MTNELEKTFFDTFGIEPITQAVWDSTETKWKNFESWEEYPQITDRILLELICIANEHENYSATTNMKNIKERTLRILLKTKKYLKDTYSHKGCHNGFVRKVRTLFEEG